MKWYLSFLFLLPTLAIAGENLIEPKDYRLACSIQILDEEAGQKFDKINWSDDPKEWPVQFDLADYPRMNEAIWFGPKIGKTRNFQVQVRTGRDMFQIVLQDTRHQPTHEHDFYQLAAAWTDLKAGHSTLSYSRSFTRKGVTHSNEVFAKCALLKK